MRRKFLVFGAILVVVVASVTVAFALSRDNGTRSSSNGKNRRAASSSNRKQPTTLDALLQIPPAELGNVDIGLMNLLCSEGLPGAEKLDVKFYLQTLDEWAENIRVQTKNNFYHYEADPTKFRNLVGFYQIEMLLSCLANDRHVHYNMAIDSPPENPIPSRVFFANPKDVFIFGCLAGDRVGCCSSLPILYVAIGRRLGYPVKLVATKAHLFCRYDSQEGTFNFERSGFGQAFSTDEHYKNWPHPVTAEEIKTGQYLKSETSTEELATCMEIRGNVLMAHDKFEEAKQVYTKAHELVPHSVYYAKLAHYGWRTTQATHPAQPPPKHIDPNDPEVKSDPERQIQ